MHLTSLPHATFHQVCTQSPQSPQATGHKSASSAFRKLDAQWTRKCFSFIFLLFYTYIFTGKNLRKMRSGRRKFKVLLMYTKQRNVNGWRGWGGVSGGRMAAPLASLALTTMARWLGGCVPQTRMRVSTIYRDGQSERERESQPRAGENACIVYI